MNRILIILTLIILSSCSQSKRAYKSNAKTAETLLNFECTDFDFKSVEEQSDSILLFTERATNANSINRQKWEQKFFCAFPNSFVRMQEVFGYDDDKGAAPLYYYPSGKNIIQYFSQLESIPNPIYFDKYVKININGVWEADNIQGAFDFDDRLLKDTKHACNALSKFSNVEIKSVFRFIFDGPHPKNGDNAKIYKELSSKIDKQDKRLSKLLTKAYKKIMAEDDGHGH